jgi:YbbR domain-containing protein
MKTAFSRFLSERARLFFLSLAIAVTLWFYVGTTVRQPDGESPTATLHLSNVKVTFAGVQAGWHAAAAPEDVDIEMRWPAAKMLAVGPADVRATADVTALQPGEHRVNLRIQVPSGVISVQANPSTVQVTLGSP